jgi:sugar-specific transcriptional regulator TrmB
MLENELIEIGLNEKEAKVYVATLELGQSVVQEIAKKSGVNRATTYFIIEGLMKNGLISSFHKGKKQYFSAADPDRLNELLDQQKEELERKKNNLKKLLPQLQSINNKQENRPVVKYYEGREGIKTMVGEVLRAATGEINMAYSVDAVSNIFTEEEKEGWRKIRIKRDLYTKAIYTYKKGVLQNIPRSDSRKVPFDKFPITCDIAVYDKKVRIADLSNRLIGVIIEDKEIARSMRAVLDLAWEAAEKYNK